MSLLDDLITTVLEIIHDPRTKHASPSDSVSNSATLQGRVTVIERLLTSASRKTTQKSPVSNALSRAHHKVCLNSALTYARLS